MERPVSTGQELRGSIRDHRRVTPGTSGRAHRFKDAAAPADPPAVPAARPTPSRLLASAPAPPLRLRAVAPR